MTSSGPTPLGPQPGRGPSFQGMQQNDLPEMSRQPPQQPGPVSADPNSRSLEGPQLARGRMVVGLWLVTLAACAAVGAWAIWGGASREATSDNWKFVKLAQEFTDAQGGENRFAHVPANGAAVAVANVPFPQSDLNPDSQVKAALDDAVSQKDPKKLQTTLSAAQQIPIVKDEATGKDLPRDEPKLTAEAVEQVMESEKVDYFNIELFDSCAEDGDVVEILLNHESYAIVPILHAPATLTVPIGSAPITIEMRGIRDGGGGITVALNTSEGPCFARPMAEGEVVVVGTISR